MSGVRLVSHRPICFITLSSLFAKLGCLRALLTKVNRCFGDKGDVEDITEGLTPNPLTLLSPSPTLTSCTTTPVAISYTMTDPFWLTANANIYNTADIISTVEFDHTGNYLATGDKGGRVVLFERNETVHPKHISHILLDVDAEKADTQVEENMRIQIPY